MRTKYLLWLGLLLALGLPNLLILRQQWLQSHGQVVYLELAPVDPRSLMQGDCMRLRYKLWPEPAGMAVLQLDARQVGTFLRWDKGEPLEAGQVRLRSNPGPTDAYYFQEGTADRYASARYGRFTVAASGDSVLRALTDDKLKDL